MNQLQICTIGRKQYFVDNRLEECRNVKNPHDVILFAELIEKIKLAQVRIFMKHGCNKKYSIIGKFLNKISEGKLS